MSFVEEEENVSGEVDALRSYCFSVKYTQEKYCWVMAVADCKGWLIPHFSPSRKKKESLHEKLGLIGYALFTKKMTGF